MEYLSKLNNRYFIILKFADLKTKFRDSVPTSRLKDSINYIASQEYKNFIFNHIGYEPTSVRLYIVPIIAIQCYIK